MTSLKRWCLLPLAASLLLSVVPAVTEVVGPVADCDQFLLDETPPQVPGILEGGNILNQNRYKPICQTFGNERRFVTLYDVENKIPVFSAYKYRGDKKEQRPNTTWKIEPQLEDEERNTDNMKTGRYNHQASDYDYSNNDGYNRGHLFPTCHAFDKNDKISTFTLTNIVPQAVTFNGGSWQKMENCVKCVLLEYCKNNTGGVEGFVVTGARPSMGNKLNNKINIPSILWSAFCCHSHNQNEWLASAHWGDNVAENSRSGYLQTKTLEELSQELSTSDSRFEAFPSQCPLDKTVAEFYPKMHPTCECPRHASATTSARRTNTPSTTATPAWRTPTETTTEAASSDDRALAPTSQPPHPIQQQRLSFKIPLFLQPQPLYDDEYDNY